MASFIARTTPTTYSRSLPAFRRPVGLQPERSDVGVAGLAEQDGQPHPDERVRLRVCETHPQPLPDARKQLDLGKRAHRAHVVVDGDENASRTQVLPVMAQDVGSVGKMHKQQSAHDRVERFRRPRRCARPPGGNRHCPGRGRHGAARQPRSATGPARRRAPSRSGRPSRRPETTRRRGRIRGRELACRAECLRARTEQRSVRR